MVFPTLFWMYLAIVREIIHIHIGTSSILFVCIIVWFNICDLPILRGPLCYHIVVFFNVVWGWRLQRYKERSCEHVRTSNTQPIRGCILVSEVSLTISRIKNLRVTKRHKKLWTSTNTLAQFKERSRCQPVGSWYSPVAATRNTIISLRCRSGGSYQEHDN